MQQDQGHPATTLDEVTALAAHLCAVPSALLTLVDGGEQRIVGTFGVDPALRREAARFHDHIAAAGELLVVPETASTSDFPFAAGVPLLDEDGHTLGTLCVIDHCPKELSPQQEAALQVVARHAVTLLETQSLRQELDLARATIDSLPGIFYLFDEAGRFLRWNRRFEELAGYSHAEFARLPVLDLFAGSDRSRIAARIADTFRTGAGEDIEADLVAKDGSATPFYFTGRRVDLDGRKCVIGVGVDVSAIRAVEEERDRLFNLSPDLLCIVGYDGWFRELSPAWERVLGHSREELKSRPFIEFVHPDDHEATLAAVGRVKTGGDADFFENRYQCRDGSWRWFSWNVNRDPEREVGYAVARDVTAQRAVADALRASEERYRRLVESARDAILTIRSDGRIASVNRAFEEMTGWQAGAWMGRPFDGLLHPDDLPIALDALGKLDREQPMPVFELRVAATAGGYIPVEVQGTQVQLGSGTIGALVIARDMRERRAMDERLQRTQRLDAIGQLAAGVAHDFNNLLMVIGGEVELLMASEQLPTRVSQSVAQIGEAAERGSSLTGKLLLLGREHDMSPELLDLNGVVEQFLPMLERLLGGKHSLAYAPASDLPAVEVVPGMMEQVLMNLAINARDAMPDGGELTLRTGEILFDAQDAARVPEARPGRHVWLEAADAGVGIDRAVLPRIFEPLFTTKAVGEGTGLGLATTHAIVRRHGGWIEVDSRVGQGTTFRLYLPAADSRVRGAA